MRRSEGVHLQVSIIGLDIAKNVLHLSGRNRQGREILKKKLKRSQVANFFAQLESCVVGIEACAGANHWGRVLEALGHRVRLLPAQQVKPFVSGAKNDFNDAGGLCDALNSPRIRAVAVKSLEQQDWQAIYRLRDALVRQRTAQCNRLRGVLTEYGVVIPQGLAALRRRLPEVLEDAELGLSAPLREVLAEEYLEVLHLDERVRSYDRRMKRIVREYDAPGRLAEMYGVGPVLSVALAAHVGNGSAFDNGRALSASLGIVPHQHSSGDRQRLLGISRRGNPALRALLVNGARALLASAHRREDRLSRWALALSQRRPFNVAVLAVANKLARIAWALLARGERFDPAHA